MPESPPAEPNRRYVVIMPSRDEESLIQNTLDCLAAQTIVPARLVIVDDGSTDRTGAIADDAAARHDWVRVVHRGDRGERKVGGGVVDAFYSGYDALDIDDYAYVCKLDADLTFEPGYFEELMRRMEDDPKLGGASGKPYVPIEGTLHREGMIDEMVAGQANFWRRACWEQIGGFVREVMWDGIVFHRARMFGWTTRSFDDEPLRLIHHRLMGSSQKSVIHGRLRWGRGQWFMGTHPLYIIASGVNRMRERPFVIGGLCIIAGYFIAAAKGVPRYEDPEFREHLHQWQLEKLHLR